MERFLGLCGLKQVIDIFMAKNHLIKVNGKFNVKIVYKYRKASFSLGQIKKKSASYT